MKSFIIAFKDFKIRITDRKGFLLLILMPIILTAILGMALNSVMNSEDPLEPTVVGIYQIEESSLANSFQNDVLQTINFIKVKPVNSEQKLKKMIANGTIHVGIVFPAKWDQNLNEGELQDLTLLANPDNEIKTAAIESILSSFVDRALTIASTTAITTADIARQSAATDINLEQFANDLQATLTTSTNPEIVQQSHGQKMVSSMQYYAAAMAAMFLLYNITIGAKSIVQERDTKTLSRLLISPTGNTSILIGKFLGNLYFAIIQFLTFLIVTSFMLNVDWGDNLLQVAVIGFSFSVAVSGLAMLLASFISDDKTADSISSVGIQLFAILGGSMLPIYIFPDALKTISNIAPNKWALTSFLDIMSGVSWNELMLPISILLLIGIISLTIGTRQLKAR